MDNGLLTNDNIASILSSPDDTNMESISIEAETTDELQLNSILSNPEYDAVQVSTDSDLSELDTGYLSHHNDDYSALLDIYVENARHSLNDKRQYKKIFYYSSLAVLGGIIFILIITIIFAFFSKSSVQTIVTLVTVATSFMTAFIVIPKIIAEYLFNTSDESNFTDIIKNMQDYDKSVREHIHTKKEE